MYTHMKNKHALDPNGATFAATQPRGRGRPKTGADGQRIDPTSDLYMKQDGRYGENPICPTDNFDEVCISIFGVHVALHSFASCVCDFAGLVLLDCARD